MRWACLLAALLSACSLNLDGFACPSDQSCGAGRSCVDKTCATRDTSCASGFRWDTSGGARANSCTGTGAQDLSASTVDSGAVDSSVVDSSVDQAQPGCIVGGTPYAAGTANPGNACQSCDPSRSVTAWSSRADGASCAGGRCNSGACCTTCVEASACRLMATTHHCGVLGAACINCDDGNACHANVCKSDGTCDNSAVSNGTPCPGTMCATAASCPGACAQCAQSGTCQSGTCGGTLTFSCCPSGFNCLLFGGRSFCDGP